MASFGRSPQFTAPEITGGPASNVGSAAGIVNLGNLYGSLKRNSVRHDEIAATGIATRSAERALNSRLSGMTDAEKIKSETNIEIAKMLGKAERDAAKDAASKSMTSSIFGAIGTVGGALLAGPMGANIGGSLGSTLGSQVG